MTNQKKRFASLATAVIALLITAKIAVDVILSSPNQGAIAKDMALLVAHILIAVAFATPMIFVATRRARSIWFRKIKRKKTARI